MHVQLIGTKRGADMQRTYLKVAALGAGFIVAMSATAATPPLHISLKHGSAGEKAAEQQLRRLAAQYDLSPWVQTDRLVIEERVVPHSHPVLTLHTRHRDDDGLLVSTFIHEQLHWWLSKHPRQTASAVAELKRRYATLPVGYPDGADSLEASYEHLLVISLELDGVDKLLGKTEEQRILRIWEGDHYRALYRTVEQDRDALRSIVRKHGLDLPS
jgi:hypothetical protein